MWAKDSGHFYEFYHRSKLRDWVEHHHLLMIFIQVCLILLLPLIVLVQLTYPYDRALPMMRIGDIDVGGKTHQEIVSALDELALSGKTRIVTPSKSWEESWQTIGVTIDRQASADQAFHYALWERLIPFSSFLKISQSAKTSLVVIADDARLTAFAKKIVDEDSQAAKDATIRVENGKVVIDKARAGYKFNLEYVKARLKTSAISNRGGLELRPDQVPSIRSEKELASLKSEADRVLARSLKIHIGDHVFVPSAQEIGKWLSFKEDAKKNQLIMSFNEKPIKTYLDVLNGRVSKPAGTSTVTLFDGIEQSRTSAQSGEAINVDKSVDAVVSALRSKTNAADVTLNLEKIPPRLNYVRNYSPSNAGLLAIIKDWDREHYGDFAVVIREIGGQNRFAQWQPDKSFVSASTFKLFVYYGVSIKIANGSLKYSTKLDNGWRVDSCLEDMIVRSTNPCAVSLMNKIGWSWNQSVVHQAGFSSTNINNLAGGHKYTTARDVSNFVTRLNAGTLMNPEATSRLLGYMKRQVWRAGIPAGVPSGVAVADKVGFLDNWIHDVGIVYAPHSTYVIGVMSNGGSDPAIAELSRRIYNFFKN